MSAENAIIGIITLERGGNCSTLCKSAVKDLAK